ncbi:glucose-6-phosphate 1-epimerase [Marchantia polymorpha subsp. ruderalis]|uniref:glucose-6-phosphate 1-epimerase n=2 Tax=Marchantia polymorpha TaxID=3197 RepID=A0AAF6BTU5_MARPO|nr:hypothetical protein MARPO_0045s0111 [Marchantia polymorpha]BBN15429.1 hypothetical protein Mp_6g19520 [Marchantia polymorpha subsp. ruderalis]|eukprot:PTQ39459.1 hypothetical protein MARPO_0045s0111 [Marchantia polymorpha]
MALLCKPGFGATTTLNKEFVPRVCVGSRHQSVVGFRLRPFSNARLCVRATQSTSVSTGISGQFAIAGINVDAGEGGLPVVKLHNKQKSECQIYLHGGVITSWKSKGKELLHVRPDAVFDGVKPISGGVPHCFPQFGPGAIQQHGFARNCSWEVVATSNEDDTPCVTLRLVDNEYSRAMWNFKFVVKYSVWLQGDNLCTEMIVKNVDEKPFSFTTALHTYFKADIKGVTVTGLNGLKCFDKDPVTKEPVQSSEDRDEVTFPEFVDRIYKDAPSRVVLRNGLGDTLSLENEGWSDAVLWNPYMTMKLYYKDFVCVENAKLDPVTLQPRDSWTAKLTISPLSE